MKDSRRISLLLILAGLFLWLAVYLLVSENPWNSTKEMALIEAGKSVKLEFQVALGMYLAAAVNLVLCTGLLVAWYFFDCQLSAPDRGISGNEMYGAAGDSGKSAMSTRAFYLALLLIVLTGGALRWQRLVTPRTWPLPSVAISRARRPIARGITSRHKKPTKARSPRAGTSRMTLGTFSHGRGSRAAMRSGL